MNNTKRANLEFEIQFNKTNLNYLSYDPEGEAVRIAKIKDQIQKLETELKNLKD